MLSVRTPIVTASVINFLLFGGAPVHGQNYPNKTMLIVTSTPGSTSDVLARLLARDMMASMGQPIVVENRVNAAVMGPIVARANPDGYTLLIAGASLWLAPLTQEMSYDPVRDFSPVSLIIKSPTILVVNPSLPVKSVKELIALAKARPGELNYASSGTGSTDHISAELFKSLAGINMVRIPYKGTAPASTALLSGEAHLMFNGGPIVMPYVKTGRLRALAVCSSVPSALVPELPTMAAAGLPTFEADNLNGFFAPAKTPQAIITRLNEEIIRILRKPEIKEKMLSFSSEVVGSSPEQLEVAIKGDISRFGKVIREVNIRSDK